MIILRENEARDDASRLDQHWQTSETFVFLPDRAEERWPTLREATAGIPEAVRTNHFALLTSGSTGEPKLVFGSRARAEALARALHIAQRGETVRQAALALPLTYCYAFVNQWLWARTFGRPLVSTGGLSDPARFAAALDGLEDAMLCLVGAQVPLIASHFGDRAFPGVIRLHFAGGRFPQEKLPLIRSIFPNAEIFNNFGCAEAMPRLTVLPKDVESPSNCIGEPLPGVEMDAGADGELRFRSPFSAVGYVDAGGYQPIGAADWVLTGDVATRGADGRWHLAGRRGEVFKRYGEKVSLPALLETVLGHWPGQAAFRRERDPAGEEGHVLVLAPHPEPGDVRGVLDAFRRRHSRVHWPLRIDSAPALPLLPNGKVDGRALPALDGLETHWRQRL